MSEGRIRRAVFKRNLVDAIKSSGSVTCQLCLKPITRVDDLTLDHDIPVFEGGNSTFMNLQAAHLKCNQQKGHRILPVISPQTNLN